MNDSSSSLTATPQAPFSIVRNVVVAHLIENFDQQDVEHLEDRLLTLLNQQRELRGVIFNFSEVQTTDPLDLRRLEGLFQTLRLVGARIGLCGIHPGLAVVIVNAGLHFQRHRIGADIDDLIDAL